MILDIHDRWVICTPTKTGTTSLTALLTQQSPVATKELPVHRPDWDHPVPDRLMTCRHPLDRWVSMWYFLQRDKSRMHAAAVEGLAAFANEFFKRYDEYDWSGRWWADIEAYMWLAPQWRFVERFRPTSLHDVTADGGASVATHLNTTYGYNVQRVPHLRKSRERETWQAVMAELRELSPPLYDRLLSWTEIDFSTLCRYFDYELPRAY